MPLDSLSGFQPPDRLAASLVQRNIAAVDLDQLNAHKQAQLKKFGPTFWYRHQKLLGFTLIGSVGSMALTAGAANSLMRPSSSGSLWISMAWMCLVAALIVSGVFRASAGSRWEERWLPIDRLEASGVPEPIAAMARSVHRTLPGSTLIIGELIRESVVLDPYLLLVLGSERVCLGIWDDAGIIASAE